MSHNPTARRKVVPIRSTLRTVVRVAGPACVLAIAVLPVGCTTSPGSPTRDISEKITVQEASALIQSRDGDPNLVILDVRTPTEFATERIAGAIDIDVENSSFNSEVDKLDKSKTYLVYCRTGRRSAIATGIMTGLGFTDLKDMTGGITAWKAGSYPTTK
jgi:rhodanese-related sulfurtransferase